MIMRAFVTAVALLLAGCVTTQTSTPNVREAERQRVVAMALEFIGQVTDYKNLPPPKHWYEVERGEMQRQSLNRGGSASATGLYICGTNRTEQIVFAPSGIDYELVTVQAGIIHELTHHGQCLSGKQLSVCQKEREAYGVEAAFILAIAAQPAQEQQRSSLTSLITKLREAADKVCALYGER